MLRTCEYCGMEFDEDDAREIFESEVLKKYDFLTKCLCGECAVAAIEDMDSVYLEECENCHSRFNPFEAENELCRRTGNDGAEIDMFDKYLCLDCALDEYEKRFGNN